MPKIIKISENQLRNLIDKQITEQDSNPKEDGSYMVLSNLMMIKDYVERILKYKHQSNFSDLVTGEHAWAGDHIATAKDDIQEVANFIQAQFEKDDLSEEKMKGKNPCWKGYEMVGKKMKGGKEVPNCVPKKKINEQAKFHIPNELREPETPHKYQIGDEIKYNMADYSTGHGIIKDLGVNYINKIGYNTYVVEVGDNKTIIVDEKDIIESYGSVQETNFISNDLLNEAEYQGRKVKLGKIMQGDVKKFKVYVKNDKGKVVKVNFGDPNMRIKKNNPERRKSFRARHKCDNPGPRWKPRYWACKSW